MRFASLKVHLDKICDEADPLQYRTLQLDHRRVGQT
jgi:hypothetical protein